MILIDIYRGVDIIATVKPGTTSSQTKKIMGENTVSLPFELSTMVNFKIGDYCTIFDELYFVYTQPVVTKKSKFNFEYNLQLQSTQYELQKAQYLFYDSTNTLREGDFTLTGDAQTFIDLLVKNINRISGGWISGGVISTDFKTISFNGEDCLAALTKIATEFGTEYYVEGTVIHLAQRVKATPYNFRYGRNKGLYEIKKEQSDNSNIITRLYVQGGERNLPPDYPGRRLRMPSGTVPFLVHNISYTVIQNNGGLQTITFDWQPPGVGGTVIQIEYRLLGETAWNSNTGSINSPRTMTVPTGVYEMRFKTIGGAGDGSVTDIILVSETITTPVLNVPLPYLEKNVDKYGIIEATYINDDIYPRRLGRVTGVDATNIFKFSDILIDFDVNSHLLPGLTAKVTFNTGDLSGYSFEIRSFDFATRQFVILKNKDEKAIDIPSDYLKVRIGDRYVLHDIKMPQSYISAAELELKKKAEKFLDLNSEPQYNYTIVSDPKYFRNKRIKMNIGDVITVSDIDLQVQKKIRVIGLTKSLIDEYEYNLELGETVSTSTFRQLQASANSNTLNVSNIQRGINNNPILNSSKFVGDLKIEQGTVVIKDIETATSTAAMKQLFIDGNGKVWKAP